MQGPVVLRHHLYLSLYWNDKLLQKYTTRVLGIYLKIGSGGECAGKRLRVVLLQGKKKILSFGIPGSTIKHDKGHRDIQQLWECRMYYNHPILW